MNSNIAKNLLEEKTCKNCSHLHVKYEAIGEGLNFQSKIELTCKRIIKYRLPENRTCSHWTEGESSVDTFETRIKDIFNTL